ncbi:MAG: hypothetical protein ABSA13_09570 [Beijerinckiaceae bacterium]|jgi:hypothetical protein
MFRGFLIALLAAVFLATPAGAYTKYLDQTSPSKTIGIGQIGRGGLKSTTKGVHGHPHHNVTPGAPIK